MGATPVWLATVEATLNRYIGDSHAATAVAGRLEGTALQVDVRGMLRLCVDVSGGRLELTTAAESVIARSPPDAVIAGTPLALVQMLRGALDHGGARTAVQVSGDAEVAGSYRELFKLARPDLEEELARFMGDLPARRLGRLARSTLAWARNTRRTVGENIAEYLQEEGRDLVNKTELDEFLQGVDELRETADRVAARLSRLEQRSKGSP